MSLSIRPYLLHIHDEIEFLKNNTSGLSENGFLADEIRKCAFVRASAGMRDRLIHGYDSVDYEIVWEAETVAVPLLAETINAMLSRDDIN